MRPEIEAVDSPASLEAYLETRSVEEVRVVALRCALRILPVLANAKNVKGRRLFERDIVVLFCIRLIICFFGNDDHILQLRGRKAHDIFRYAREILRAQYAISHADMSAVASVINTLSLFPVKLAGSAGAHAATYAIADATDAIVPVYERVSGTSALSRGLCFSFWEELRRDLHGLAGGDWRTVFASKLWHDEGNVPASIKSAETFSRLDPAEPGTQLLRSMYRRRRNGLPLLPLPDRISQRFFRDLASQDGEFWDREPHIVITEILERLPEGETEYGERLGEPSQVERQLIQTPAAFRFSTDDHSPIDAIPMPAETALRDFAVTMLAETREKACSLLARLEGANAARRVVSSVRRLSEVLPEQLDGLNPALLRSRTRSLEADAIAFSSAGAEAELFADAVAAMLDLTATAKDLQSCFSEIASVEREAAKIEIAGREDEAEEVLAEIHVSAVELSARCPQLVTENAAAAVGALKADIADAPNLDVKSDLLASASLVSGNFVTAAYRKVLSTAGREALQLAGRHYQAAVKGSVVGTEELFKKAPLLLLACYLGGPLLAGAAIFSNFKSLKDAKDMVDKIAADDSSKE